MKCSKEDFLLYAITDRSGLGDKSLPEAVLECLKGGISLLQFREKNLEGEALFMEAKAIHELCQGYGVSLIINDNVDLALALDAEGVHLGQDDMGVKTARQRLGPGKIIGVSAHSVEEALMAKKEGADYLGVGAVFQTASKADAKPLERQVLKDICRAVDLPVVAIGGITEKNVLELTGTGIDGVAVIGAVFSRANITEATRKLKVLVTQAVRGKTTAL